MSLLNKVVIFGDESGSGDSGIQVFWDDVANVDSEGEPISEYYPGDSRYFLVIVPDGYRLLDVKSTDGAVSAMGSVSRPQVDRVLFDQQDKLIDLSQQPAGGVSPTWYGNSATETVEGKQVKASAAPCLADIEYSYAALQYRLTAPATLNIGPNDDDDWPIGVVVYAEVVP
jgi:hypothetical protein